MGTEELSAKGYFDDRPGARDRDRAAGSTSAHSGSISSSSAWGWRRARAWDPRLQETDVSGNDPIVTGKIALAHLTEFPDYYTRLAILEREAAADLPKK